MGRRSLCQCVRKKEKEQKEKRATVMTLKHKKEIRLTTYRRNEIVNEKKDSVCEWVLVYPKQMIHPFPLYMPPHFRMSLRFAYSLFFQQLTSAAVGLQSFSIKRRNAGHTFFYFQSSF